MERIVFAILLIVGVVNALPVIGLTSAAALDRLYDIAVLEGDLLILMRHRALLFSILGGLMVVSAFQKHLRGAAMVAGLISMVGFIVLALMAGDYGGKLYKIVLIDALASVAVVIAAIIDLRGADSHSR